MSLFLLCISRFYSHLCEIPPQELDARFFMRLAENYRPENGFTIQRYRDSVDLNPQNARILLGMMSPIDVCTNNHSSRGIPENQNFERFDCEIITQPSSRPLQIKLYYTDDRILLLVDSILYLGGNSGNIEEMITKFFDESAKMSIKCQDVDERNGSQGVNQTSERKKSEGKKEQESEDKLLL